MRRSQALIEVGPKEQPTESIESYRVPVISDVDPTSMTISFAAIVDGEEPVPATTWSAGLWSGSWENNRADALTPLIGKTGGAGVVLELASGVLYDLWWQIDTGTGEAPMRKFDQIKLV